LEQPGLHDFVALHEVSVIAHIPLADSNSSELFQQLAQTHSEDFAFGRIYDKAMQQPMLSAYNSFGRGIATFEGLLDSDDATLFLRRCKQSAFFKLDNGLYQEMFSVSLE
jgi:hypothetical protein